MDIKTRSVHFYAQMTSSFTTVGVIPFQLALLNEGGAMDLSNGIFTAPVSGIYHFEFSGVKDPSTSYMFIYIQVNGNNIGVAYTDTSVGDYDSVSLTASIRLNKDDWVNLFNAGASGGLYEYRGFSTHFTGWLVEEDL